MEKLLLTTAFILSNSDLTPYSQPIPTEQMNSPMKLILSLSLISLSLIASLSASAKDLSVKENSAQLAFFNSLSALCGERYEGAMTFPLEGQDSFSGKLLVAEITSCTETEDHSRTWIISKTDHGLQLKHDHRHQDGTPDEVNMYGGIALSSGSNLSQSFAADAHTATIIPAATTNVWTMTLSTDTTSFTYHLTRHDAPRFTAQLFSVAQVSKSVAPKH
jgi:hypothetical protein